MKRSIRWIALVLAATPLCASAGTPAAEPLTLREALQLAGRNNEAVGVAATRLDVARAQRREARALLLPRVTLAGTYTRRAREVERNVGGGSVTIQALNAFNTNLTLQTTLFDASAIPVVRRADRLGEAAALSEEEVRRDLAFDVAESFFSTLSSEQLRAAARTRVEVAQAAVDEARARFQAGLASSNDVTRSELELASAQLARTRTENAVVASRLSLGYLLGADVAERPLAPPPLTEDAGGAAEELGLSGAAALETPAPAAPGSPSALGTSGTPAREAATRPAETGPSASELDEGARGARKDLAVLEKRVEAARLAAQEPWLQFVPALGLTALWRATNEAGFSGRNSDWSAALTLSWALYDGGLRYARAAARAAELREAELNRDALGRRIGLELRMSLNDLQTARAAVDQARIGARVARQNAEEVQARFSQGLASALERADANASQFEADAEMARQEFALRLAQLSLVRALGRWPGEHR